jgi:hypothetical protein
VTEVVRAPTRVGSAAAIVAAGLSVTALVPAGALGAAPGVVGFALVAVGLARGKRTTLTGGAALLLLGAIAAATTGVLSLYPLLAAALAVVAWDAGENAIGLGEQLGRVARTTHAELTHVVASALVGIVTAVGAFLVYRVARGGRPMPALVLLLVGAVVLMTLLRR